MSLTSKQRAYLKGLAHEKKPVILVGNKGITEALVKETKSALLTHELIKVRLADASADTDAERIATEAGAQLVEHIGRVVILYKRHPHDAKITLPKEKEPDPLRSK